MKYIKAILVLSAMACLQYSAAAQTNAPVAMVTTHTNMAIIPIPRTGSITNRQTEVLARAKNNPGD